MPQWKDIYSDAQRDTLIAYLRFLGRYRHELMGNSEIGLQLYQK